MSSRYEPPAIFVNWQDQTTRKIYPVGRLVTLPGGTGYEFAYINAAHEAQEAGFAPFQAFPDFGQVYRAPMLPAFFKNRVLQPRRPDYPQYLQELGFDTDKVPPLEILARSGGRRVTDPLEVFAELVPAGDRFEGHFFVRGIRHLDGAEDAALLLKSGDPLRLKHDPSNRINANAHLVICHDGQAVGYVPDYLADDVRELLQQDESLRVEVVRVNQPPAPSQQRLLCKLSISSAAPRPHRRPRFDPISPEAIRLDGSHSSPATSARRIA